MPVAGTAVMGFLALATAQVGAQPYDPVRPLRLIVSVPAGGGVDVVARIMAEQLRPAPWGSRS